MFSKAWVLDLKYELNYKAGAKTTVGVEKSQDVPGGRAEWTADGIQIIQQMMAAMDASVGQGSRPALRDPDPILRTSLGSEGL